ncbi:hypothetical protein GALL_525910 [mine drainage metagenome]|uniref:Uncharacterized protein n=1 Tax=mine drainage metagenome TaxID=410659 RepID=A0A1J5P544_9ZZZZ
MEPSERPIIRHPGEINTSTVAVCTEDSLSTSRTSLLDCIPSSSDIGVRKTTRSPASNATDARSRRSDASPRKTSTTRTDSRLKISTSSTFLPISPESSGTATSVKNFIFDLSLSSADIDCRSGNSRANSPR